MTGSHSGSKRFEQMVSGARERLGSLTAPPAPAFAGCLGFAALRRLVLEGQSAGAATVAHLRQCARCTRLMAVCAAEMPHLPWWVLLRVDEGRLTADEERAAQHHLLEGGCTTCASRQARLRKVGQTRFRFARRSPHVAYAASATPTPDASPAPGYNVELLSEPPRLEMEIRTREAGLRAALFGYCLFGPSGTEPLQTGYLPLSADQNGWYTARVMVAFSEAEESAGVQEAVVQALQPEELLDQEVSALLRGLDETSFEAAERQRWGDWLRIARAWEASTHPGPFQRLLRELAARFPA